MDITSLIGPIIALVSIVGGMVLEGGHVGSLIGGPAAIIVFGGSFGAICVANPLADVIGSIKALGTFFKNSTADPDEILKDILDLAQTARKESILALEKKREAIKFAPLAKVIKLAVDGTDPNVIRDTLETEAHIIFEDQEVAVRFWEDLGAICPTVGILGAVLGLIHVMENLAYPERIGPGIAVAFVATLYGVGAANIFFLPIGKKIKRKAIIDGHARAMVTIGVEGILSGMNPKVIEEKLAVFCHGKKVED